MLRVNEHFIRFIKTRFAHVNSDDHQQICLLWPQILVLKLNDMETPTVDYMCFQIVPLRLIFRLCVSFKIRLVYLDHFIPKSVNWGERVQTTLVSWYKVNIHRDLTNLHILPHQWGRNWQCSFWLEIAHSVYSAQNLGALYSPPYLWSQGRNLVDN